jgi:peptidoglycan/LPS O-acetylase OafA/YrhL
LLDAPRARTLSRSRGTRNVLTLRGTKDIQESERDPGQVASTGIRHSTTYLFEVEALRGIAMTLVYVFHVNAKVMGPLVAKDESMSLWWAFVRAGDTGVSLFFVLSGFLLSLPFLAEAAGGARVDRRKYFTRRALRILPLFYVAVVIAAVLTAHGVIDLLQRAIPHLAFLTYVPGWGILMPPYSNTWWSLSTEAQYYVLLPLLPFALRAGPGRWAALAVFLAYATAYTTYMFGMWHVDTVTGSIGLRLSLFGRAPLLLCGIAVAFLYFRRGDDVRAGLRAIPWLTRGGADLMLLLTIVVLGVLLRWTAQYGPNGAESVPMLAWHIPEGLLWAVIVMLVILAPLRVKPLIANPLFGYLGVISYSMYMWHTAILYWVFQWVWDMGSRWPFGWSWRTGALALLVTVASLAVSQLTYTFIERPFLARKARVQ